MAQENFTPNVQLSEFALKLRKYRQSNRLSQGEAAARLGVSLARYGAFERDQVKPTAMEKWRFNRLLAKQKTASTK